MKGKWSDVLGYFIVVCVMIGGFAYVDQSRQDSTDDGRAILCTGIIANTGNVARDDPFVIKKCGEVGVVRDHYPPTVP